MKEISTSSVVEQLYQERAKGKKVVVWEVNKFKADQIKNEFRTEDEIIYVYTRFFSSEEQNRYPLLRQLHWAKKREYKDYIPLKRPTKKEIKQLPKNILRTIVYTSSYKNIKTMTNTSRYEYDEKVKSYYFEYEDYHHTMNIVKKNPLKYELIRLIYKYLTIIFSIICLVIYLKNILKFDEISIISHILIICYILIIGGVAYTHTTSFHAIRPLYLGNIYILQNIFILVNFHRLKNHKKEK